MRSTQARKLKNLIIKWQIVNILLLIVFIIITLLILRTYTLTHRPKTNFIFSNKDFCATRLIEKEKNEKSVVIVVLSKRENFMNRDLVRQTWGSIRTFNSVKVAVIFMLGNSIEPIVDEIDYNNQLEAERIQFGDIVVGDFVDAYRNLTLKTIMAYEWLASFCRDVQYMVKTDDDVVVNIFKLTEALNALSQDEMKSSNFWCDVHHNEASIMGELYSIQYPVLPGEFPNDTFPSHCNGIGYVTTMYAIARSVDEISRSFLGRVTTHESVFTTGLVREKINSKIIPNTELNFYCHQNDPIKLIGKGNVWMTYLNDQTLKKILKRPFNETENIVAFQKKYKEKIFYNLRHGLKFEKRSRRLWKMIKIISKNNELWEK